MSLVYYDWKRCWEINTLREHPREIEIWPVAKLVPYERNARTHSDAQLDQIASSIREFGFTNPILVAGDAGILAGHGRLAAAKRMGLTDVPVIVLDHMNDAQRRAYVLADNKLALNEGWDEALLSEELQYLQDDGFDVGIIGFSDDELEPKYCDVIVRRWQEYTGKLAVHAATGKTFDECQSAG